MVWKLENTQVIVDGRSVFRGLVALQIVVGLCSALYRAERRYADRLNDELKRIKKEQKLSKKSKKVESK